MGYDNGIIRLFDLTSGSYIWETNLGDGVCIIIIIIIVEKSLDLYFYFF